MGIFGKGLIQGEFDLSDYMDPIFLPFWICFEIFFVSVWSLGVSKNDLMIIVIAKNFGQSRITYRPVSSMNISGEHSTIFISGKVLAFGGR